MYIVIWKTCLYPECSTQIKYDSFCLISQMMQTAVISSLLQAVNQQGYVCV